MKRYIYNSSTAKDIDRICIDFYGVGQPIQHDNTKIAIKAAKESSRGVFWVVDDELLAFPFGDVDYDYGISKSGNTYNHKRLWDYIKPKKCNKPFDYYPRGRVEFSSKGEPIIYMNPNISEDLIPNIKVAFGLRSDPIVRLDYSDHYKCYLDN